MNTIPTLSHSENLLPNHSRPKLPAPSGTPEHQAFREKIKEEIKCQQFYYIDSNQEQIMSQLYNEVDDIPLDDISLSALRDEPLTETARSLSDTVRQFVTKLKQEKLHSLDIELARKFSEEMVPDVATAAMRSAVAKSRLQALTVIRSTQNRPIFQICLDEHIAAAKKQMCEGEGKVLFNNLPEIITSLKSHIELNEKQLSETEARYKKEAENQLLQMVSTAISKNKDIMAKQNALLQCQIDIAKIEDLYQREQYVIGKAANQLAAVKMLLTQSDALPLVLLKPLQGLYTRQQELAHTEHEYEYAASLPKNSPVLQQMRQQIKQVKLNIEMKKQAFEDAKRASDAGSTLGDILLGLKRLFGREKGQKSRAEHRRDCLQYSSELSQLEKQATTQRSDYSTEEIRLNTISSELRKKAHLINDQIKLQYDELIELIKNERYVIKNDSEKTTTNESIITQKIKDIETDNELLHKMQKGEPLIHLSILRDRFADLAELVAFEKLYAKWQHSKSTDCSLWVRTNILKDALTCAQTKDVNSLRTLLLEPEISELEIGAGLSLPPADTQTLLTDAADLYAMLCTDKLLAHPLYENVMEAERLMPSVMEKLSALEKMINSLEQLPGNTQGEFRNEEPSINTLSNIKNNIGSLRRIVSRDFHEFEPSAGDFNAQHYHPGQDIYIDKQGWHGTCVMHTWNNLMAHVTDNQQMILTPRKTEQLAQALITKSADEKLNELIEMPLPSLAIINDILEEVIHASELIHPACYKEFTEHGYFMSLDKDNSCISEGNLNHFSNHLFKLCDIDSNMIDCLFDSNTSEATWVNKLNSIEKENYDAISIGLHSINSGSAHAIALLKKGSDYLLVDSNYEDPVSLSLSQLTQFIINGTSTSEVLDKILQNKNYNNKNVMFFDFGLYKKDIFSERK